MPITWDSRLETGCEDLDVQHRTLVETFNRLSARVGEGTSNRNQVEGILVFLRDFALTHFKTEQELMARHGYPGEEEHRKLHSDLAAQLDQLLDAVQRGETAVNQVTLDGLDAWLTRHIQEEDFRLAEFLRQAEPRLRGAR